VWESALGRLEGRQDNSLKQGERLFEKGFVSWLFGLNLDKVIVFDMEEPRIEGGMDQDGQGS
jgi:hypothetical protein